MTAFFDKKDGSLVYAKLMQDNEQAMRTMRIGQAEAALQQMKQEIEHRTTKLDEIFKFLDCKKELYEQLTKQYTLTPTDTLATQLSKLKQATEQLVDKLNKNQPEKIIADLSAKYEELKTHLMQKMMPVKNNTCDVAEPLLEKNYLPD